MTLKAHILLLLFALSCGAALAQQRGDKIIIDIKGRRMMPVYIGDSTAIAQVGDVVVYHNGTAITCDSLVQFSEMHVECFGNIIINKESTYAYGDRLDYDGEKSIAQVFSPLIKMVDGDAVLYTYNFRFNTRDNIGEYYGGGTIKRNGTLLESDRGFYYANSKDVICAGKVELRDSTYQIKSDSLGYNMDSEVATFYSKSYIWNEKGEILSADKGWYYTQQERYRFISNAYVLAEKQEIWADDIDYDARREDIIMRRNIQVVDEEHKTIGFGDYGLYYGQSGNAMLTERPSVINYDETDSIYVRADSMFMHVVDSTSIYSRYYSENKQGGNDASSAGGDLAGDERLISSGIEAKAPNGAPDIEGTRPVASTGGETSAAPAGEAGAAPHEKDSGESAASKGENAAPPEESGELAASAGETGAAHPEKGGESAATTEDKVISETPPDKPGTKEELQAEGPTAKEREKAERKAARAREKAERLIAKEQAKAERKATKERERAERNAARELKRKEKAARNFSQQADTADSVNIANAKTDGIKADSIKMEVPTVQGDGPDVASSDSVASGADAKTADNQTADANVNGASGSDAASNKSGAATDKKEVRAAGDTSNAQKEKERVVIGYHNVKIFRSDLQAICDSLIGFSADSTLHLHLKPVIWNEDNQTISDLVTIHTRDEKLDKAIFKGGNPVMASKLDATRFNQMTGRVIEAFFRDNELYRVDALGDAQTYYYDRDEKTGEYQGFSTIESSDITFKISNRAVDTIVYRVNPVYAIYPMNKIPGSQPRVFPNFKWMGELRPSKSDVFDRQIRATRRKSYLALPLPHFPLTERIHIHRKSLISGGTWHDRTDDISRSAKNFIDDVESGAGISYE